MTREQAIRWRTEINAFTDGAKLLVYVHAMHDWTRSNNPSWREDAKYIIDDIHVEARKAFALGEPIESRVRNSGCDFVRTTSPIWTPSYEYRPVPKPWYEHAENMGKFASASNAAGQPKDAPVVRIMAYVKDDQFPFKGLDTSWKYAWIVSPDVLVKNIV